MRTVNDIKHELDRAVERRRELWRAAGAANGAAEAGELARLNARIPELWEELRIARTRRRFGSPEPILRRADRDRRLERAIDRAIEQKLSCAA